MVRLLEGIKVVDYSPQSGKPRAWINSGTVQPVGMNFSNIPYSHDAFVPIESWRNLNRIEQRLLFRIHRNDHFDKSNHLGIIRLPKSIAEPFGDLGVALAQTAEDCEFLAQQSLYRRAIENLVSYLSPLYHSPDHLSIHPLSVNLPGLPTVTYNPTSRQFIGLHLDSWDKQPIENRHLSSNRICINLGLEDRFFLFINLTLLDILHLIQLDEPTDLMKLAWENRQQILRHYYFGDSMSLVECCPIAVRHDFLTGFPSYPVIKLRVSPGEAYIAPTENMIHDGCTLDKQFCDLTLTIRGHIELPLLPSVKEKQSKQRFEGYAHS